MQRERRRVLITGASSGIGKALAELFLEKKYEIHLSGRNASSFDTFKGRDDTVVTMADLSTEQGIQKLLHVLKTEPPDILINNAGFGLYGPVLSKEPEEWEQMLRVNCSAVLRLTQECAKQWVQQKRKGVILNVSSVAGEFRYPNFAVYAASKAFVTSFSEAMDFELKGQGVRVLAACPGQVATQFRERAGGGKKEAPWGVMSAEKAALHIWKQIQKQKTTQIFHWPYRVAVFLSKYLIPRSLLHKILAGSIDARINKS